MHSLFLTCASLVAVGLFALPAESTDFTPRVDRGISAGAAAIRGFDHSSFHPGACRHGYGRPRTVYRSDLLPNRPLYGPYSSAARYRYAPYTRYNGFGYGIPSYSYGYGIPRPGRPLPKLPRSAEKRD